MNRIITVIKDNSSKIIKGAVVGVVLAGIALIAVTVMNLNPYQELDEYETVDEDNTDAGQEN